jgi:hypothetical protein
MPITITSLDKTKLKVSAAGVPVSMTDFKVNPPVKLGVFKTDPNVKISFDWVVGISPKAGEAK